MATIKQAVEASLGTAQSKLDAARNYLDGTATPDVVLTKVKEARNALGYAEVDLLRALEKAWEVEEE